jgi:hypothetical protein
MIAASGVEQISGLGASSIAREPGFYHSKMVVHHYEGQGHGLIWSVFGKEAHPLKELDMLPENTALAAYSDMDVPLAWQTLKTQLALLHNPDVDKAMAAFPAQFKARTGIGWDDMLGSLGGGYGVIFTLDDAKQVKLPIPTVSVQMAEPGLALFFKVKNDVIFNLVDEKLAGNPMVLRSDEGGVRSRTMAIPIPSDFEISPTIARRGDYLFVTSSQNLLHKILAVQDGKEKGYKSTAEFKRLSQGIPMDGNNFTLVSEKLGRDLSQALQGVMGSLPALPAGQAQSLQMFLSTNKSTIYAFSVGINGPDGWESLANGNKSMNDVMFPAVGGAAVGLLSAIAIPNFVRARATSQENACINNLRVINAAKQQWALEKGKSNTDIPTEDDIRPYMGRGARGEMPTCPAGGHYIIGAVGEKPRCSIEGHVLP